MKTVKPIPPGHERAWYECKQCGNVCYRDYVPYSFSTPIITLPCGHFSPERDNGLRQITADAALIKLVAACVKARAALLLAKGE